MIIGLNHVTLAVKDVQRSFEFYNKVLGLKPLVKWDKGAYFLIGGFWFCLNQDDKRELSACYTHYAFSVDLDQFGSISQKLSEAGVTIFKENTSPGESLYFLDPDGHKLELHVGSWHERIAAKKLDEGAWRDVQWFV